jgi:hypothetical protein
MQPGGERLVLSSSYWVDKGGDFRRIPPQVRRTGSLKVESEWPILAFLVSLDQRGNAWLGREDSNLDMANWNRMLSPVREEPQNLFSLKFIGPSKRWNFENRTESAESRASEIKILSENNKRALPRRGPEF